LIRSVAAVVIIVRGFARLSVSPTLLAAIIQVVGMAAGILVLMGLWTPISGSSVAALGIWNAVSQAADPWADILLAAIGAALALVGPGAWSVDARLFGWKRIDLHSPED
jgi:putative oxidoreductase